MLINSIILVLWYFLPAAIANGTPVVVMHLPILKKWNYPLDCYKTIRGVRIFGEHKSWRGLVFGVLMAIVTAYIQLEIYKNWTWLRETLNFDFTSISPLIYGTLAGLGAILGDAIKSFFKRRINIKPGSTWFPFDQIDYIIGGILFLLPYIRLSFWLYLLTFVIWFGIHLISTYIGFLLKLKDKPI